MTNPTTIAPGEPGAFTKLEMGASGGAEASASAAKPPAARQASGSGRFRVVGGMLRALARWQNALNPSYQFGTHKDKMREQEESGHRVPAALAAKQAGNRAMSTPVHPQGAKTMSLTKTGEVRVVDSARTQSGRPREPGQNHGHKAQMLFKPLPPTTPVS